MTYKLRSQQFSLSYVINYFITLFYHSFFLLFISFFIFHFFIFSIMLLHLAVSPSSRPSVQQIKKVSLFYFIQQFYFWLFSISIFEDLHLLVFFMPFYCPLLIIKFITLTVVNWCYLFNAPLTLTLTLSLSLSF